MSTIAAELYRLSIEAHTRKVSWQETRQVMNRAARADGQWAGYPMPVAGMSMQVHPSYPFAESVKQIFQPEPKPEEKSSGDDTTVLRNTWRSYRDGTTIHVLKDQKGFFFLYGSRVNTGPMVIETMHASLSWDFEAELRAQETLKRHLSTAQYQCYIMTGCFPETSKRSGVVYVFRRLRPTIAMTDRPDFKGQDKGLRILCTLCLHPVGYFTDSWAGALVPTDDVIAHILLMRADEADFWRQANQHPAWAPGSGI